MRATYLFSICLIGIVQSTSSGAVAAPAQLYGKSIIVAWSEERSQRVNGEANIRNVVRFGQFSVYVSSAGKAFSRMTYLMGGGRRGGMRSGNRDAVGGESRRNVSFSGNTMSVVMPLGGGARNVVVNFDGGSCRARVIMGKEAGSSAIRSKSIINGSDVELLSVKTGDASCRIQDGNVFGE